MHNQIDADYSKTFLFPPSIEDFVSADDPVRFIRSFVDSLDMKALGFKERETLEGRPNYAPGLLLKVWLYGSYERIVSSRKLERQCTRDVALMWLCGLHRPDHNTLWRFFHDNKGAIKNLFRQSVQVAMKNGLVGMVYHAIDGTKVGARASRYKSLNKEEMRGLVADIDAYIDFLEGAVESGESEEPEYGLPAELQDAKLLRERVSANVAELLKKDNGSMSMSDIESRKMRTNRGTVEFCYNAQAGVDSHTGIIVGAGVSHAETDNHLLTLMVDEIGKTTGGIAQDTTADAGYFSGDEIAKVESGTLGGNVYVNIPREHNRSAEKSSGHRYHSDNFAYDKGRDVFVCPDGWILERGSTDGVYQTYVCEHFAECANARVCTTSGRRKHISIHQSHEAIRAHKLKITQPEVRMKLQKRGELIERVFGWIKECWGLRRLPYRGISNAQAIWYLACTIYNLRKILTNTKAPQLGCV